mmetsp:Transcript_4046/g.7659  ORF Transcript_4046/g.7659 Transcript_4046/m.7659 type:complete len:348 (+) Transcript_4046:230-1273(+)|eukprot:CAMPEP_0182487264 /NCGR_PEP_ID=MMETSP1319-20130603/47817_1 /TAXON_ID=172717 /ORGANISM="Bolidomonas pacifica, Strain RCC208" /LENGTH=347 /DNA_ID=CAMNT_0024689379 /DNA_START=192 /DNA_END=1235 /DNA_ORIENTATION=+
MSSSSDPPLPPGWTKAWSNSQRKYYWHHASTKTSQWHPPTATEAANPLVAKRRTEEKTEAEHGSQAVKKARTGPASTIDASDSALDTISVAIIVPYRDLHPAQNRAAHLERFHPHMVRFLKQNPRVSDFKVFIIEQSNDGRKFNRGKLLNIGYDIAKNGTPLHFDSYIFHDVDLLPSDDVAQHYGKYPEKPIHIARCWDRYSNNPKYFGGIVSFNASHLREINGYPNNFWGWGGEDDELQLRCATRNISWSGPTHGTITDLEDMNVEEKMKVLKGNKEWKCNMKWEVLEEHKDTWSTNGLSSLTYSEEGRVPLGDSGKAVKVTVDVGLNGGHWTDGKSGVDDVSYEK